MNGKRAWEVLVLVCLVAAMAYDAGAAPADYGRVVINNASQKAGLAPAVADILLPEGRTVELVVREALAKALNEQGYEVVDAKSPQFDKALPVQVDIDQFWAWFSPGFWQVSVEFRGVLILKAEALTGRKEDIVRGTAVVKGMVATDAEWKEVVVAGVSDLTKNLRAVIKPAN